MVHGVTRPTMKGIPLIVKQNEVKKKGDLEKVRHSVKAAVLKGDPDMEGLVALSIYDSKPTYFMSTVMEGIEWDVNKNKVFNSSTFKTYDTKFLRLNWQNRYNFEMDHTDVADQLVHYYQIGIGLRNTK